MLQYTGVPCIWNSKVIFYLTKRLIWSGCSFCGPIFWTSLSSAYAVGQTDDFEHILTLPTCGGYSLLTMNRLLQYDELTCGSALARLPSKIATSLDEILFYSANNAKSISLAREQALVSDVFPCSSLSMHIFQSTNLLLCLASLTSTSSSDVAPPLEKTLC